MISYDMLGVRDLDVSDPIFISSPEGYKINVPKSLFPTLDTNKKPNLTIDYGFKYTRLDKDNPDIKVIKKFENYDNDAYAIEEKEMFMIEAGTVFNKMYDKGCNYAIKKENLLPYLGKGGGIIDDTVCDSLERMILNGGTNYKFALEILLKADFLKSMPYIAYLYYRYLREDKKFHTYAFYADLIDGKIKKVKKNNWQNDLLMYCNKINYDTKTVKKLIMQI